ncbi:MAG: 50S ribosomal protein L11 methyltransferase [Chromatiales bacterium]|nr:50S ribosomal protein L11 methyltransferase [Chromatiales bacterium]
MSWLQLTLDTSEEQAPILELVFENLGALSVTLGDAGDQPLLETPPASEQLWQHTRVTALFEGEQDQRQLQQALDQVLSEELLSRLCWERIEDRIWERVWLEHFKPMSFGKRLWVCPAGEQISEPNGVVIQLDPGLAFGTGTHPTTALCLTWLDSQDLTGKTVIDYGCGSGILAIAALKLGASSVIAIDHDPQALQASQDNALKNDVADRLATYLPNQAPALKADYLVANILAGPLIELAPQLIDRIKPNGLFALSGILAEQSDEVAQHYLPFASLDPVKQMEEWILISGVNHKNA